MLYPQSRRRATNERHRPPTGTNSPSDDLRASDAEREAVLARLREHAVAGRLDISELEERLSLALAARTRSELAALECDLPELRPQHPGGGTPVPCVPTRLRLRRSFHREQPSARGMHGRLAGQTRLDREGAPTSQVGTGLLVPGVVALLLPDELPGLWLVVAVFFILGCWLSAVAVYCVERRGRELSVLEGLSIVFRWGVFTAGAGVLASILGALL